MNTWVFLLLVSFAVIMLLATGVAFFAVRNARRVNGVLWGVLNPPREIQADRLVMALSSTESKSKDSGGTERLPLKIMKGVAVPVTARVQDRAFRPERVIIAASGTKHGSADWLVNDIKVANQSQFCQAGDILGDMFSATAIDAFVSFDIVQVSMDFTMIVTYIGENPEGAYFNAAVLGSAASDMPMSAMEMPPLSRKEKKLRNKLAKSGVRFGQVSSN